MPERSVSRGGLLGRGAAAFARLWRARGRGDEVGNEMSVGARTRRRRVAVAADRSHRDKLGTHLQRLRLRCPEKGHSQAFWLQIASSVPDPQLAS